MNPLFTKLSLAMIFFPSKKMDGKYYGFVDLKM
jgi:hypothetical protein